MNWNRHVCCTMALVSTLAANVGFGQNPGDSSHIPRLQFRTGTGDWPRIQGELPDPLAATNVYALESSADLRTWRPLATLLRMPFAYPDADAFGKSQSFYRVAVLPKGPTNDWANQIKVPSDPFFSSSAYTAAQQVSWVKFLILLDEPERVYFQDSRAFPLHYDFASRRVPAFIGILDPWLEPELPASTQAKLIAANIRLIHLHTWQFGGTQETITILGLDNVFRTLARPSSENQTSHDVYDPKHLFNQIAPQSPVHPK